jgi:hypothetical protein
MKWKKMADAKPEKETWLNYIIQPFNRHFFGSISYLQLLTAKDWRVCFFLKPL